MVTLRRKGISLVEIAVVALIASLLINFSFKLYSISFVRFSKQEEMLICTAEASILSSWLRYDFEDLILATGTGFLEALQQQISCTETSIKFPCRGQEVLYIFQPQERNVIREADGRTVSFGKGFLASFSINLNALCTNGTVRNLATDNSISNVIENTESKVCRVWFNVCFYFEGKANIKNPVRQIYKFNLFPVRLNRQLQSVWKTIH